MVVRLVANQNTRVRFPLLAQSNENTPLIRGVFSFALVGTGIEPEGRDDVGIIPQRSEVIIS